MSALSTPTVRNLELELLPTPALSQPQHVLRQLPGELELPLFQLTQQLVQPLVSKLLATLTPNALTKKKMMWLHVKKKLQSLKPLIKQNVKQLHQLLILLLTLHVKQLR